MSSYEATERIATLEKQKAELLEALHLVRMSLGWQYLSPETQDVVQSAIKNAGGQ